MRKDDCFLLGYVIKPHGLKGEVSVLFDVDFPEEYSELESVFLEINQRLVPFFITAVSVSGDRAVVQFEDLDTFEKATELKGAALYLPDSILPEMGDSQFYFHEVIGYMVRDEREGEIGRVTQIYSSGRQDLLAVDHNGLEVLIPLNDEIVVGIDKSDEVLSVSMPDGLMDIFLNP